MDRPLTLKSGVALQSNYSVQHRSDILMEEQIETVRTNQEAVKKALADLEKAKSEEDIDRCRQIVQDMREKSVKSVMALQVLHKVNTELMFARAELDAALEKQRGDINEARKRVMWLEDRMGVLCGKVRMRGQPVKKDRSRSYRSPDRSTFRSRLGSDGESSDDAFDPRSHGGKMGRNKSIDFKSDTTRRQQFSPSDSGSEYGSYQPQARAGMMDTPSSGAESYIAAQQSQRMRGPRMDDSDSESETATPQISGMPQTMASKTRSVSDSGSESDDEAETQKQTAEPKTPASGSESGSEDRDQVKEDASESESDSDSDDETAVKQPEPFQVIQIPSELGDQSESRDALSVKFEEGVTTSKPDKKPTEGLEGADRTEDEQQTQTDEQTDEETGRERSDLSERTESGRSSVSAMSGESTLTGQQQEDKKAFMTEASIAKSVTIKTPHKDGKRRVTFRDKEGKRRVTFRDPTFLSDTGDKERTSIHHLFENDEDWARDYWYSEHHRFEYSEYSEVLCDMDPLSYHSMGLAVPGTFIEKSDMSFHDLPWRARRKGSEVTDIHKIALDKLASRVHSMYGKVYDAAMLSVQPTQTMGNKRETTMFSSFENSREAGARSITPTTDGRPGMVTAPPTTADATSRPQTVSTVVIPIKLKPGLNVYHPKPIPPPEMLPLTRTSKDKEYPRLADSFSLSEISKHKPAVRIVDQRNLHKETKLKLFKERPKEEDDGPSTTEKKFRMMLEREKSTMSRSSRSSRQTTSSSSSSRSSTGKRGKGPPGTRLSMVRSLTKASTWSKIKPSSRGKEYGGLKWERVKTIVHVNLVSTRSEERKDAAKHLGILRCGDAMVFYALKERLRLDDDSRVRYEAAKSLILLGCWDEEVIQMILMYLVTGNTEIRQDLIKTMIDGKNVQYVNKKIQSFPELVKVLSHFCRNPDPDDTNAFDAAVLLGKFCVADENAKFKLLRSLDQSADTHIKAKALEVLTKQLSCTSWDVVKHLLVLFQESPVWKYRALAADLLIVLGRQHVCKKHEEEKVYHILERKLWDDPTRDVRIAAAKALTALGMFGKACERIEKRLEDTDEDIRAQAVISVGTLEMKNEKIIRLLLEMLELDSSEYVRLMIARTFTILKMTDKRVLRALRERDKVEGPLARESRKALKVLESLVILPRLTTPGGQKSITSRATPQASPGNPPALTV